MNQLIRQYTTLVFILIIIILPSFGKNPIRETESIKIDSVTIRKNWRTKEEIILRELGINKGARVTESDIESSIDRIWNIGNFAKVSYTIDTLESGNLLLNITAQDALTIMPVLSFFGNREEYKLNIGVFDNNMLGRNISLGLEGAFGTNVRYGNINAGNAADVYWHLFNTPPLASAGSSLRLMVPMVPWLAISFHYAWMGKTEHWLSADF